MVQQNSALAKMWDSLTVPNVEIRSDLERQRARTLSGVALSLVLLGLLLIIAGFVFWSGSQQLSGLMIAASNTTLWILVYALSRTTYARQGAVLLVFGQAVLVIYFLLSFQDP